MTNRQNIETVRFDTPIYVTRRVLPPLERVTEKLKEIWDLQWLTNNGPQLLSLEGRLLETLKVPALSLFNNGTTALMAAFKALQLEGEVITPPFTSPATTHVAAMAGLTPVFADIDPLTLNLDPARIEAAITSRTRAILGVHVFGTPCDVFAIQEIARKYELKVIYDAAHAFGVEIDGTSIGSFGDFSMFSFHATKLFHTVEGGALVYPDRNYRQKVELFRNFGIKNEEEVVGQGINGKLNELQAALGLLVLDYLEEERRKRWAIRDIYYAGLGDVPGLTLQQDLPGARPSLQYFTIRIDENLYGLSRDDLYLELKRHNVYTRKYFYPLCSSYPDYKNLPSADLSNLPIANRVVQEVLCLPFFGGLELEQAAII